MTSPRPFSSGICQTRKGPRAKEASRAKLWCSRWLRAILAMLVFAIAGIPAAAEETAPAWGRPLPFFADWAVEQGIDLPNPFGVSLFMVTMSRDIQVTDVRVTLPGNEPADVSDVASFDVRNRTTINALRLDTWILPLLNLYVLGGHTLTDARLNATVTVDRRFGPPATLDLQQDALVWGPMFGTGATLVGGYGPWFAMVDANYNYSAIEELDNGIAAWLVSARTGWSGGGSGTSWRVWVGAAWLATSRTLIMTQESAVLGSVKVEVDQQPVDPRTFQLGYSLGFGKNWEFMLELGSNFADASMGVFSLAYRL